MSLLTAVKTGDWARFSGGCARYIFNYQNMENRVADRAAQIGRRLLITNIRTGGSIGGAFRGNTIGTIARKGSSSPLVETNLLSSNGSYHITPIDQGATLLTVSRISASGVELGGLHEEGAPGAGFFGSDIPARPWFVPTINSSRLEAEVTEMASNEMLSLMARSFGRF